MILTNDVYEYDAKHAGISILYEFKAITKERYDYLRNLEKHKRVVQTGLMIRDDANLYNIIAKGYKHFTDLFIKENKLKPHHIIEIVNDAVWVSGKAPEVLEFGEVKFRRKQHYHITYIYERKNLRFYYNLISGKLFCRGSKLNEVSKMFNFMKKVFKLYDMGDKNKLYHTMHRTLNKLKKDPDAMGSDLCRGLNNITLVKALIKDLINF